MTHTISVTVHKDSIRVNPDTLTMTALDEVQWAATNTRRFSIVFAGASPFAERELTHEAATRKQRPRAKGRFKYAVVSAEDPRVRVDPVVIVEEPPSRTTP